MSLLRLCICILLILSSWCYQAKWGERLTPATGKPPKRYILNLDLPPQVRWTQIIQENKQDILLLIEGSVPSYAPASARNISYQQISEYDRIFADELQGIANILEIPIGDVFWLNMMYDSNAFCTSLIVQDENNNIIHARNLDYGWNDLIVKLYYDVEVYRNGELLYYGNFLGGFVGLCTGLKPYKFAISGNQRISKGITSDQQYWQAPLGRLTNLWEFFYNKRIGMLMAHRKVFEEAESYTEAIKMLSEIPLLSPVYYIVSGTKSNEGIIIEMDRDGPVGSIELNIETGRWFLVQTNYDRDVPDPLTDDRRTAAEDRLQEIGRSSIDGDKILNDVLARYPNLNSITIESVVFSAQENYFNITLWE